MVEDYELQQYTLSALRQNEVIPIKEEAKKESETPSNSKLISSNESSESVDQTPSTRQDGIVLINNLKAVFCKKGEMLLEKAIANNIRYARLLEINELNDEPLQRDMFIFLEPKSSKGAHATYIVSEAETIEEIAQKEGMNSRQLRIYNLMAQNEQAVAGSVLKLQEQSDERPTTYKMQRVNISKEIQTYKLKEAEQKSANSEFVPTKKNTQQVEEIEMGYGAERPAFLTKEASLNNKEEIKQVKVEEKIQAVETDKKLEEKKVVSDEPLDEIALLKARLDKAVYAKKASSNIKVSSSDTVNISAPNAIAKPKIINHPTNTSINEDVQYHVVEKGDTGYSIAKKYGIKIKQLNEWNNLNFDGIKIGQKLRVK
jgi:LysM repeat protein